MGPQGGGVRLGRRWGGVGCGPVLTINVLQRLRGPLLPEVPLVDSLGSKRRELTNRTHHQPLPIPGCGGLYEGLSRVWGWGGAEGGRAQGLQDLFRGDSLWAEDLQGRPLLPTEGPLSSLPRLWP